jgi:WD40 repeat protein
MERNKIITVSALAVGIVAWRMGAMEQAVPAGMIAIKTSDEQIMRVPLDRVRCFDMIDRILSGNRQWKEAETQLVELPSIKNAELREIIDDAERMRNEPNRQAGKMSVYDLGEIPFDQAILNNLIRKCEIVDYLQSPGLMDRYKLEMAGILRSDASVQQLAQRNNSAYITTIKKLMILPYSVLNDINKNMELWAETATLRGHNNGVSGIAWNPNGAEVATISQDHRAIIWDAQTGKQLKVLNTPHLACAISFSPDGRKVTTAECDGQEEAMAIVTWDVIAGKEQLTLPVSPYNNPDADDEDQSISKVKDNRKVAKTFTDFNMAYLNLNRAQQLKTLSGHTDEIVMAEYSPTGRMIATVSWDRTARIWDASGNPLQTLDGHSDGVYAVAFSPDESKVATGSRDGILRIWDVQKGTLLQTLRGHQDAINSVMYCKDGSKLVTASKDRTARIWDAHVGRLLQILKGHEKEVLCAVFSPKGDAVATTSRDNTAKIFRKLPQSLPLMASAEDVSDLEVMLLMHLIVWARDHNERISNPWARGIANNIAWDKVEPGTKKELKKLMQDTM